MSNRGQIQRFSSTDLLLQARRILGMYRTMQEL